MVRKKFATALKEDIITATKMCAVKTKKKISHLIEDALIEYIQKHGCCEYLKKEGKGGEDNG